MSRCCPAALSPPAILPLRYWKSWRARRNSTLRPPGWQAVGRRLDSGRFLPFCRVRACPSPQGVRQSSDSALAPAYRGRQILAGSGAPRPQRAARAVADQASGLDDHAGVLVPADERLRVRRARVPPGCATAGVRVRASDPGVDDPPAGPRRARPRSRKLLDLDPSRAGHDRRPDAAHGALRGSGTDASDPERAARAPGVSATPARGAAEPGRPSVARDAVTLMRRAPR